VSGAHEGTGFRSIAQLAAAYREGRTTPRQVADRALESAVALDRRDPPMRLFIALDAADVRAQADAAGERHRAGRQLSLLDGVPVAIKDELDVRGYGTTCGTSFLGKTHASTDALTVARLRAAGAVIFGKTNMHEFGVAPSGVNVHHGTARNPYDPARDTGGSSSGSGAAVAAGIVPLALGNDGGGSVRIPGALCGVPSLKATFDRIPTKGVALLCWSLEHTGPIAATVEDVRLAFAVLTGEPAELPALPSPLRLGVCDAWWQGAAPAARACADAAIDRLVADGAIRVPIELPHIDYSVPVGAATFIGEGAAAVEPYLRADQPMAPSVRLGFEVARGMSATTFVKAQRVRTLIARDFERAFAHCDLMVTPTTAISAPPYPADAHSDGEIDEKKISQLVHFTFALNLTGHPAAQVPCGYDADGMPLGLQLIAPHGADLLTLAAAAAVERSTPRRLPPIWHDLLGE
jgi:Asp-tRNA(Asn)/Glu-tRNA(Gln) amidotransferase A subunit family amidase